MGAIGVVVVVEGQEREKEVTHFSATRPIFTKGSPIHQDQQKHWQRHEQQRQRPFPVGCPTS